MAAPANSQDRECELSRFFRKPHPPVPQLANERGTYQASAHLHWPERLRCAPSLRNTRERALRKDTSEAAQIHSRAHPPHLPSTPETWSSGPRLPLLHHKSRSSCNCIFLDST